MMVITEENSNAARLCRCSRRSDCLAPPHTGTTDTPLGPNVRDEREEECTHTRCLLDEQGEREKRLCSVFGHCLFQTESKNMNVKQSYILFSSATAVSLRNFKLRPLSTRYLLTSNKQTERFHCVHTPAGWNLIPNRKPSKLRCQQSEEVPFFEWIVGKHP